MSQTQKKSGGRDISDLKARLGLQKGGRAATQSADGVVAPPGVRNKPAGIPAPPGAKPPAPAGPVMPQVSDDPFAAMNAMAAVGTAQRAAAGPEIIVVNDGRPVEKLDSKSRAIVIGKYAAMIVVPLVIGIVVGQMSYSAKVVNRGIDDATVLATDIKRLRQGVNDSVLNSLLRARERGQGGNAFKVNDEELTKALGTKGAIPEIDPLIAFHSHMYELEPGLVADILQFYSDAGALTKSVDEHVALSKRDASAMNAGQDARDKAAANEDENRYTQFYRYAVFVQTPDKAAMEKGEMFGAKLVEIGAPICQDDKPSTNGKCQGAPIAFQIRDNSSAGWLKKGLANAEPGRVPADNLIPLVRTGVLEQFFKGSPASVAETAYMERVRNLFEEASALVELGVRLEEKLNKKAKEGKSFTFFL